jgi:hypothetical protein
MVEQYSILYMHHFSFPHSSVVEQFSGFLFLDFGNDAARNTAVQVSLEELIYFFWEYTQYWNAGSYGGGFDWHFPDN